MKIKNALKIIHHRILILKMIIKRKSLFGNYIQKINGRVKTKKVVRGEHNLCNISVIVLNYNNKDIINKCIGRLLKFNSYNYEIILVDNGSNDGSLKMIKDKYGSKIRILSNKINGCASGRNLGAKAAKGDFLLFLDSDQWPVDKNWLNTFIYILNKFPDIGAVGWEGGFFTEPNIIGPTLNYFRNNGLPNKYLFRTNIDYLSTNGFMISKKLFKDIGGFDINYDPHIFEDADISRKIISHGRKIAYCTDLKIFHQAHSTTKSNEMGEEYLSQFAKNADYFRKKWLS